MDKDIRDTEGPEETVMGKAINPAETAPKMGHKLSRLYDRKAYLYQELNSIEQAIRFQQQQDNVNTLITKDNTD